MLCNGLSRFLLEFVCQMRLKGRKARPKRDCSQLSGELSSDRPWQVRYYNTFGLLDGRIPFTAVLRRVQNRRSPMFSTAVRSRRRVYGRQILPFLVLFAVLPASPLCLLGIL